MKPAAWTVSVFSGQLAFSIPVPLQSAPAFRERRAGVSEMVFAGFLRYVQCVQRSSTFYSLTTANCLFVC